MGNKAAESLNRLGIQYEKVRHPAQGGRNGFIRGMAELKEKLKSDRYREGNKLSEIQYQN